MTKKIINFRITPKEDEILTEYARATDRSKTDIIRELIRTLAVRVFAPKERIPK